MAAVDGFLRSGAARSKRSTGARGAARARPSDLKSITPERNNLNLGIGNSEAVSGASGGGGAPEIVRVVGTAGPDTTHAVGGGVRGGDPLKLMATDAFVQFQAFKASLAATQAMVEPLEAKLRASLEVRSGLEAGTSKTVQQGGVVEKAPKTVVCKRRTLSRARFNAGWSFADWAAVARLAERYGKGGGGMEAMLRIVLHVRWRLVRREDSTEDALRTEFLAAQSLGTQAVEERLEERLARPDGGLEDALHAVLDAERRLTKLDNKEEEAPHLDDTSLKRFGAQTTVARLKKRLARRDSDVTDAVRMAMGSVSRIEVMKKELTARQAAAAATARSTALKALLRRKHVSSLRAAFNALRKFSAETAVAWLRERLVRGEDNLQAARWFARDLESRLSRRKDDLEDALRRASDAEMRAEDMRVDMTAKQAAATATLQSMALKGLLRRKHSNSLGAAFDAMRKVCAGGT